MNDNRPVPAKLWPLIDAALDGSITGQQASDLQLLLENDRQVCRIYSEYARMEAELHLLVRARIANEGVCQRIRTWSSMEDSRSATVSGLSSPIPSFPSITALHGELGYFSSDWLVSYLIATVIMGIGALIAGFTYVSHPTQVVRESDTIHYPLSTIHSDFVVGRITGMIDCKWERSEVRGQESETDNLKSEIQNLKSFISLGDKLVLHSGFLEITYDTGAKVILQGPVTYEVDSKDSGFLSLGKLTARVEKKAEEVASGQWSVASESKVRGPSLSTIHHPLSTTSSLSTIHHPLFTIKTPIATVTDLGTKFGVEVQESGNTAVHVLRGIVEVQPTAYNGRQGQTVRLTENESLQVENGEDGTLHRGTTDAANFVWSEQFATLIDKRNASPLQRWQSYSQTLRKDPALIAYYTFETTEGGNAMLPNLSATGKLLDGEVEGAEWVSGRFPGKFALYFHGPGFGDRVVLPEQERFKFTGPFTVAVWFRVTQFSEKYQPLVAKGGDSWRLERHEDTNTITFDNHFTPAPSSGDPWRVTNGQTDVNDRQWHLAVAVYEPAGKTAKKRLYIDGRLDAENESPLSLGQNDDPVWLGSHSVTASCEFQGHIDEVAILARPLSADEVTTMFDVGCPVRKTHDK